MRLAAGRLIRREEEEMSRMISRSLHARIAPSTRGDFYEVAWAGRDLGGGMGVQSLTIVRSPILLQDVLLIIVAVLCQSKNWVCYNMVSLFIETTLFPGRCGRHDLNWASSTTKTRQATHDQFITDSDVHRKANSQPLHRMSYPVIGTICHRHCPWTFIIRWKRKR